MIIIAKKPYGPINVASDQERYEILEHANQLTGFRCLYPTQVMKTTFEQAMPRYCACNSTAERAENKKRQ